MPTQLSLFGERRLIKNPLCCRWTHCGHQAELGEPVDLGGCVNTPVRCTHCGADGVQSENKENHDGRRGDDGEA